jgi:steroid delta-isomerase-like uncharacterized protein
MVGLHNLDLGEDVMAMQPVDLIRTWFEEVWNNGRVDLMPVYFHKDGVAHGLIGEPHIQGPEEFKVFYDSIKSGFPDIRFRIEDAFGDASQAVIRWSADLTHEGDFMGVKATGRRVKISGITIVHVENGQVVRAWNEWDRLTLMTAIGHLTSAE